jgi:hypothetical protein
MRSIEHYSGIYFSILKPATSFAVAEELERYGGVKRAGGKEGV